MPKKPAEPKVSAPAAPYLPIARRYRPQTFEELIGQAHVTATLTRAIESGRVAQAYLFAGQRGVGKTSAARILAKGLNCARGATASPCQTCPSCVAITKGHSLDVVEIDGASNRGIDEVRGLRETVAFAPTQGAFRIYIIDEVHMLTVEAFNALLKTLEEPPSHVKFIFATTSPQKVPSTILSRCQRFDFRRVDGKTIVAVLRRIAEAERVDADDAALFAVARAADGSLRDAEVVFEQLISFADGAITEQDVSQLLGALEQDALLSWAQAIVDRDAGAALRVLLQQLDRGKDVMQLLVGLLMHFRNLLVARSIPAGEGRAKLVQQLVDLPVEQLDALDAQAKPFSPEELLTIVQLLTGAYDLAKRSPFSQAIVEFAIMKLATRESWASIEELIQRVERLGQGSAPSEPAPASSVPALPKPAAVVEKPGASRPAAFEAGSEMAHISDAWPKILERIGQKKMSVAAYLMDGRPLALTGDTVQIGLPAFSLHQEVLSLADHMRCVQQAFNEVLGRSFQIEYTRLPEPAPKPSASQAPVAPVPQFVQEIVKLFDATIVPPKST